MRYKYVDVYSFLSFQYCGIPFVNIRSNRHHWRLRLYKSMGGRMKLQIETFNESEPQRSEIVGQAGSTRSNENVERSPEPMSPADVRHASHL